MRPGRLPEDHPLEQAARAKLQELTPEAQQAQQQQQQNQPQPTAPNRPAPRAPTNRWT